MLRLRRLELTNFRSYTHRVFDFSDPRTLIIGENGAGKSTLPDAIALALTGRCRGLNDKGEGVRELIRTGAAEGSIRLVADGFESVVTINALHGASRTLPVDMIMGQLGTTKAMVTAAIYGSTFFDMHHTDAKALLMRLLHVQVKVPLLPVPEGQQPGFELIGLDEADRRYKMAFENRASLKRSVAAMKVPDVERRIDLEMLTEDELKKTVADAKICYEAVVAATADVRAKAAQLKNRKRDLELGAVSIDTLTTQVATYQGMLEQQQQALTDARADLAKADQLKAESTDTLAGQVNELRLFIQRVEGQADKVTKTKGPVVPTDCVLGKGIPCLTPAKEFTGAIAETKKQLAALERRIDAGTKRATAIATATAAATIAEKQVRQAELKISELRAKIDAEQKRQAELAAVTIDLHAVTPQLNTGEEQIDEASVALSRAQTVHMEWTAYQRALKQQEQAAINMDDLKSDLADAEALVLLLGPNGARATALEEALRDFHLAVNAALEPFQFELTISVDPWGVLVKHPKATTPIAYELLSKGQRLWTGLAFQLALAAVSGLEFVVVDDAEGVVGQARAVMTELILTAPIGQIVVVKAQAAGDPIPSIEGLQVVQVDSATPVMAIA